MAFQVVEARGPPFAVGPQPCVELAQRIGAHAVDAPLGVDTRFHESRIAQHPQMLRHRGLAHRQRVDQIADRPFLGQQEVEDAAAVGLGQDFEGLGRWSPG